LDVGLRGALRVEGGTFNIQPWTFNIGSRGGIGGGRDPRAFHVDLVHAARQGHVVLIERGAIIRVAKL
jgi:hypothetical protein